MPSDGTLLIELLDAVGAAREDARARVRALALAGIGATAIVLDPDAEGPPDNTGRCSHVAHLEDALALVRRWSAASPRERVIIASAGAEGGALAARLDRGLDVCWWPTAIGTGDARGRSRPPQGLPLFERLTTGVAAALDATAIEPLCHARGRLPLWDGDYLLSAAPLDGAAGAQVLESFAELADDWSGIDLVVLADPDPAGERLARERGVGMRVHYAGRSPREAEMSWLSSAAAVVLATRQPVASSLVMRTLACGAPLLALGSDHASTALAAWLARAGCVPPAGSRATIEEILTRALERDAEWEQAVTRGRALASSHGVESCAARLRASHPSRRAA